jgi:hypothetical protein
LLCLLDIKIVHTLSNKATTGSQQETKKERKKEQKDRKHISLCMPTPYTTTHVAMLA